jgi:hypothetical protein
VNKSAKLTELYCYNNQLTCLDISNNTKLTELECNNNQLTSLDVSKNTALLSLYCGNNRLTSLDTSACNTLFQLMCANNYMDATALDAMLDTLHSKDVIFANLSPDPVTKSVFIANNGPDYNGSGTSGCNKSIATSKGWVVNPPE